MITEPRTTRQQVRANLGRRYPHDSNTQLAGKRREVLSDLRLKKVPVEPSEATFTVGTTITWTSSNLEKTGEIVAVVPAAEHPSTDLTPKVKDPGAPRDHETYVVKANGKHYWPRVSLLTKN